MINKNADGLRGLAAFNVAMAHFVAAFLPMMLHKNYPEIFPENTQPSQTFELLTSPIASIFYNGHFAVLIFYILSGYVLTLPYFLERSNDISLKKRLLGRYVRLNIPIAAAIVISFAVYRLGWYKNIPAAEVSGSVIWLKKYFAEGLTLKTAVRELSYESILFGKGKYLPPLWTLKIEFIGSIYLLAFFIVKPKGQTLVPMAFLFALLYVIHKKDSIYFYSMFFGSLFCLVNVRSDIKYILFFIGLYFGAFQFKSFAYDFLPNILVWDKKTFYNAIGVILVSFSVINGFGEKILHNKLLQFLGRISFSLYLIHFIVLCSLSSFVYLSFPQTKTAIIINLFIYVFVCFIASKMFELTFDKPAISFSHKFSSLFFNNRG